MILTYQSLPQKQWANVAIAHLVYWMNKGRISGFRNLETAKGPSWGQWQLIRGQPRLKTEGKLDTIGDLI